MVKKVKKGKPDDISDLVKNISGIIDGLDPESKRLISEGIPDIIDNIFMEVNEEERKVYITNSHGDEKDITQEFVPSIVKLIGVNRQLICTHKESNTKHRITVELVQ